MNKHGQTLIIFVILIPIIILMTALVVDTGLLMFENRKANNVLDNAITVAFKKNDQRVIEDLLKQNDIPTKELKITSDNSDWIVELDYKINALFGKIVGINNYDIHVKKRVNNELKISKE